MIKQRLMPALFLACVLLFGACNESVISEIPEDPVTVTFNVSTLNVDTQPMSRAAANSGTNLEEVVNTIGYHIFNSSGLLYKSDEVSFKPGVDPVPDGFGEIKEVMMPDTYELYFYAYGKGNGTASWQVSDRFTSGFGIFYKDKEIFFHHTSVEVTATKNFVEIPLTRKSALLVIDILDEVPETVSKVEYKFNDSKSYLFYYDKRDGTNQLQYEATITDDNKISKFEYYVPFPAETKQITINIYDSSGLVISTKNLTVPMEANHKTIISGNLFNSLGEKELTILLDDIWGDDIEYEL